MKCVILGGGGFIGSAIADALLVDSHEVTIFERPRVAPYRKFLAHEKVKWVAGDLSHLHDISEVIDGADVVLHLISTTLPKNSNDDTVYDVQSNLVATLQLLNAMVVRNVKKIVFISSGGTVYGIPKYTPIDEQHPTDPLVSYGVTKLAIEKYLHIYERLHGIKSVTLRVSNPYGERQRVETAQGAVGVFLYRALQGLPIEIWGDGNVVRDYLYIQDVARAFVSAVNYEGEHRIFNISSGSGASLNELIAEIEKTIDKVVERRYLPARPFDVQVSILDNKLARTELSWEPVIGMRDGLGRTYSWVKQNVNL